jgi:hypothetical protein
MSTIKQQTSFKLNRSAEKLFPLFSPEGEKYWAPGWDYENIMGSTDLHEDYVFLTATHHSPEHHEAGHHKADHHGHRSIHHNLYRHSANKMIWLVKRHEPENYFVQYYRVEPNEKVGIITVHCKPITKESTEVEVAYEYIGLSENGNNFIKGYTAEMHEAFIADWPKFLENYFNTKSKQ